MGSDRAEPLDIPEDSVRTKLMQPVSRRQFLKFAGVGGLAVGSLYLLSCKTPTTKAGTPPPEQPRQVLVADATMMILGDPTRCVGCRRCEIACTSFNEGLTQPALSRVKINRNYLFGPQGSQPGFMTTAGVFGNGRIIQDTCRQCPHPVPCLNACPYGAIESMPPTNARVVNADKCTGCRICQRACPWGMPAFNAVTNKASKCHLCGGDPECVKACPTGALQYVAWFDRTKDPVRMATAVDLPADVKASCVECH